MRYVEEFRDPALARRYADEIARTVTRPWTLMEICGGQTHAILRHGIDRLLPDGLTLIHGPGCPVCVTPDDYLDKAVELAARPGLIFCSFGDMLRVPGNKGDLAGARARGGDVRIVHSPMDALAVARANPDREVVFFAVGFETTAPANAMAIHQAKIEGLSNFSALVCHVLVPPAMVAILEGENNRVQAFLAAGHVCTVTGIGAYGPLAARFRVPIVVTGFEPLDILQGVLMCVRQLEEGRAEVENQYVRAVRPGGNGGAMALVEAVFEVVPRRWRGIGVIPASGLAVRASHRAYDAEARFGAVEARSATDGRCLAGDVLRGKIRPTDCPSFATACTPETPLGVTMVSGEGACAAYYRYRRGENV